MNYLEFPNLCHLKELVIKEGAWSDEFPQRDINYAYKGTAIQWCGESYRRGTRLTICSSESRICDVVLLRAGPALSAKHYTLLCMPFVVDRLLRIPPVPSWE